MLEKIKFWKKSSDAGIDNDLGGLDKDLSLPGGPEMGAGAPQGPPGSFGQAPNLPGQVPGGDLDGSGLPRSKVGPPPPPPPEPMIDTFSDGQILPQRPQPSYPLPQQGASPGSSSKDLEIISAKLDSLRISLDNINQRLANLERIAYGEQEVNR